MNDIILFASLFPILLSLIGVGYFIYLHRKNVLKTNFKHLLIIVLVVSVAMSGFRVWYNLNYSTVDCNDSGQCFVGWGEHNGNISTEDIKELADLNYSLDDAPIPYLVWGIWSTLFGVNGLSFLIITEVILGVVGLTIFWFTKRLFPLLLFQLAPLTLSLTNTFAVLDDVIGFFFFVLIVVVIETNNVKSKKLVYPLTILTVLSHKIPTLYLLCYFLFKKEYKGLALLSTIILGAIGIGYLGYPGKIVALTNINGAFLFEPLLSFVTDTGYLIQILVVAQSLFLGIYFVKTRNPVAKPLLVLAIFPFVIPFNSGDHTLLWRMVWLNIVLVPLMFYNTNATPK